MICLAQSQEYKINSLTKEEWQRTTFNNKASLLTDLFVYHANVSTCQVSSPSPMVMNQEDCDVLLSTISSELNIPSTSITDLHPTKGWNVLFINSTSLHLTKPEEVACHNNMDPIFAASSTIQETLDTMTTIMSRLDSSLGSNFMASLADHLVSCGTSWAAIQRDYIPNSDWQCPPKRTKRFTLLNIGSGSATLDKETLTNINENFKTLHGSQLTLLKELEMLKAGEHLLNKLQSINSVKENHLENLVTGMNTIEAIRLRLRQQYSLNAHLVNLVQNDMKALIAQMEDMINILDSIVLDSRHYCHGLLCIKDHNTVLSTSDNGVLEFSRGAQVSSEEIQIMSCHMTREGMVMRDNKKQISFSNETTVMIDEKTYTMECLKNEKKCPKDSFMDGEQQILAGKFFFTILPDTVHIQCKEALIIMTNNIPYACDNTPRPIQFPFTVVDGEDHQVFGWADLISQTHFKTSQHLNWDQILAGHHEESFLERQAPKDILSLIKTSFAKIGDTRKLNSHHYTGIAFFLSGLLSLCPICCAIMMCKPCLRWRKARKATEASPSQPAPAPAPAQTTWTDRLTRMKFWRKASSSQPQPDDPQIATAPPLALSYAELERKQKIEEAANKLLELSRN